MGNVQVSLLGSFLCTGLPDVGTQSLAAGGEDNMSASVMGHQLSATGPVNLAVHSHARNVHVLRNLTINLVHHNFSNFDNIHNVIRLVSNFQLANIILLSARCGIECTFVQNDQITFTLLQNISEHGETLSFEFPSFIVFIVKVLSFRQVHRRVKNSFSLLADTFLASGDFVIQVAGDGHLGDFGDLVGGDAPRLNAHDPIVDGEFVLFLGQQLL